jgi:hypothetical protein
MAVVDKIPSSSLDAGAGKRRPLTFTWLVSIICMGLLVFVLVRMVIQFVTPPPPSALRFVQDIPMPSPFPDANRTATNPFAPGVAVLFDHFDFQVLDPQTHLLFMAHTGPAPDREAQVNHNFNPDKDAATDGNVVVFNVLQKKIVGLLPIPQGTGVTIAPDLEKVYVADGNDNSVYVIDERTLKFQPIELAKNDSPDGMEYDQPDHLVFVAVPGAPANPDQSNVVDKKNQNVNVIDALTDKVVARVPLGMDGKWGDDVGHVRFDPVLDRVFVVVQQLADPDSTDPNILPPPGTARLVEIDPVTKKVVTRLKLPYDCITPHGLTIDTEQHIAYVACVDADPPYIVRIDLRTMQLIAEKHYPIPVKPDILAIDYGLHLLYMGCGAGVAIFKIDGRNFTWLTTYNPGVNTHSVAVNQETHEVYLPLVRIGGRAVLRIMQYKTS